MSNATTGSDRVVPGQQPPEQRASRLARLARPAATHWQFTVVIAAAIVVRLIVILGYPPILSFDDSYNYLYDAYTHIPDPVRANGYPFFLELLLPLHSDYPIGLVQAAMGVVMGVLIYALLRHRGLPWWGAALPALPVLFDSYELHLEHMITADVLFIFLVTVAIVMLCWSDRPSVVVMAVAGLLIGYATVVRSAGQPLLVVALVAMLVRRVGWRRLAMLLVAGVVPIVVYMAWFHGTYGKYALTESRGPFLYSRVSTFAECSKIKPPADLLFLCDPNPPQDRPPASQYVWSDNDLPINGKVTYTPLYNDKQIGNDIGARFTPVINTETQQFAERAIEAQPVAYVRVVLKDILHTFGWNRQPDPGGYYENANGNGPTFQFVSGEEMTEQIPWYATPIHLPGTPANGLLRCELQRHPGAPDTDGGKSLRRPGARVHEDGPAMGAADPDLPAVLLPARHATRPDRAHRRRGGAGPLAPLGWCRPAALDGRGAADRAAADDRRLQLPVHPGRHTRGVPGGRARLRPRGQVSARPGGRSAAAPWPRRRRRAGIASAACRGHPRQAPAPARRQTAPSRSRWPCRAPRR